MGASGVVRVAVVLGLLLVLAMLLAAVHLTRPRRLRFSLGVPRVFEVRLEVENDDGPRGDAPP